MHKWKIISVSTTHYILISSHLMCYIHQKGEILGHKGKCWKLKATAASRHKIYESDTKKKRVQQRLTCDLTFGQKEQHSSLCQQEGFSRGASAATCAPVALPTRPEEPLTELTTVPFQPTSSFMPTTMSWRELSRTISESESPGLSAPFHRKTTLRLQRERPPKSDA